MNGIRFVLHAKDSKMQRLLHLNVALAHAKKRGDAKEIQRIARELDSLELSFPGADCSGSKRVDEVPKTPSSAPSFFMPVDITEEVNGQEIAALEREDKGKLLYIIQSLVAEWMVMRERAQNAENDLCRQVRVANEERQALESQVAALVEAVEKMDL